MGQTQHKSVEPTHGSRFDANEIAVFDRTFQDLSSRSIVNGRKNNNAIDKTTFLKLFKLPGMLGERLFDVFDSDHNSSIDREEFIAGLQLMLRGSQLEKCDFIFQMFDMDGTHILNREELKAMLNSLVFASSSLSESSAEVLDEVERVNEDTRINVLDEQVEELLEDAFADSPNGDMSMEAFKDWVLNTPDIFELFDRAFRRSASLAGLLLLEDGGGISSGGTIISDNPDIDALPRINLPAPLSQRSISNSNLLVSGAAGNGTPSTLSRSSALYLSRNSNLGNSNNYTSTVGGVSSSGNQYQPVLPATQLIPSSSTLPPLHTSASAPSLVLLAQAANASSSSNAPQSLAAESTIVTHSTSTSSPLTVNTIGGTATPLTSGANLHSNHPTWSSASVTGSGSSSSSSLSFASAFAGSPPPSSSHSSSGGAVSAPSSGRGLRRSHARLLAASNGITIACSNCNHEMRIAFCFSCGTMLGSDNRPCKACGEQFNGNLIKFCMACGFDLSLNNSKIEPPLQRTLTSNHKKSDMQLQGYLFKIGATFKQLVPRWFVLKDNFLYSFRNRTDLQPSSVTFLEGCFIEALPWTQAADPKLRFGIDIIISDGGSAAEEQHRTLYARTAEERDLWMAALHRASNVHNIEDYYEIGHELGVGRFSSVRLGTHKITGKKYAIKIIDKSDMDMKEREALRAEIAVLKLVKHPNVIHLKNQFETRKLMYIVMGLCSGGDLFDRLVARRRFAEPVARSIVKKLLSVVQYLHDRGIVHRDLKPENIMMGSLDRDDDIMIGDFGLSKFVAPHEIMKLPCGTLTYVAPEVLTMKGYGSKVDIWSVGVITFLLLRGRLPFDGRKKEEIVTKTISGHVDYNDDIWHTISQDAKDFVSRCLTVDSEKRIGIEAALAHPWIQSFTDPYPELTARSQQMHQQHLLELQLQHQQELLAQLFCNCPPHLHNVPPRSESRSGSVTGPSPMKPVIPSAFAEAIASATSAIATAKGGNNSAAPSTSDSTPISTISSMPSSNDSSTASSPRVETTSSSPLMVAPDICLHCGLPIPPSRVPSPSSHRSVPNSHLGMTSSRSHHNLQSLAAQTDALVMAAEASRMMNQMHYSPPGSSKMSTPHQHQFNSTNSFNMMQQQQASFTFQSSMQGLPPSLAGGSSNSSLSMYQSPPSSNSGASLVLAGIKPSQQQQLLNIQLQVRQLQRNPSQHHSASSSSRPATMPAPLTAPHIHHYLQQQHQSQDHHQHNLQSQQVSVKATAPNPPLATGAVVRVEAPSSSQGSIGKSADESPLNLEQLRSQLKSQDTRLSMPSTFASTPDLTPESSPRP